MRPPMLLGPNSAQTWSVLGDPLLAVPAALDCAIASLTRASGMVPSALARWRYIQSSAPTGSGVAFGAAVEACSVPPLLVTAAVTAARRIARTTAAAITGAYLFFCMYGYLPLYELRACAPTP